MKELSPRGRDSKYRMKPNLTLSQVLSVGCNEIWFWTILLIILDYPVKLQVILTFPDLARKSHFLGQLEKNDREVIWC